jgi:hypothetical protein
MGIHPKNRREWREITNGSRQPRTVHDGFVIGVSSEVCVCGVYGASVNVAHRAIPCTIVDDRHW